VRRCWCLRPRGSFAIQVEGELQGLRQAPADPPSTCVLLAASDTGVRQIAELKRGVEGARGKRPGRLASTHVQNKTVMFNQVSVLILDEADRMMDMGFMPDIRRIISRPCWPTERQNLLFSATFP